MSRPRFRTRLRYFLAGLAIITSAGIIALFIGLAFHVFPWSAFLGPAFWLIFIGLPYLAGWPYKLPGDRNG